MFDKINMSELLDKYPILADVASLKACGWLNPRRMAYSEDSLILPPSAIVDAEDRLKRFAPFIREQFPETEHDGGLIESPLREVSRMRDRLNERFGNNIEGRLLLKMDSHLPIAGSIKARGGIYEILKYAETLAVENGFLKPGDDYAKLARPEVRDFFGRHKVQVGSTGNLGLSIGIISAKLGFQVIVHMSSDAKRWKKELLRSKGVKIVEYPSDYSEAVRVGRMESDSDPLSYFVDDENSADLFLGYSVAGPRLKKQLDDMGVIVDGEHPLFVYIPCGVGGAPGGVTYGLKAAFGDNVHCFFTEPTHACCMLVGMASGLYDKISVQDLGLDGVTHADGLAVGRSSSFVGSAVDALLSGIFTAEDGLLFDFMRDLIATEDVFIEPSACAAFAAFKFPETLSEYCEKQGLAGVTRNITHIAWATGGSLVPAGVIDEYKKLFS